VAELARLGYAQTDQRCGAKAVKHMGPLYKDANGKYLCTCAAHGFQCGGRACCEVLQERVRRGARAARRRLLRLLQGRLQAQV